MTSVGIVERYELHQGAANIMQLVSRRTVYSYREIEAMADTPTKVMLFRLAIHLVTPVKYLNLKNEGIVSGPIQSITKISDDSYFKLLTLSGR